MGELVGGDPGALAPPERRGEFFRYPSALFMFCGLTTSSMNRLHSFGVWRLGRSSLNGMLLLRFVKTSLDCQLPLLQHTSNLSPPATLSHIAGFRSALSYRCELMVLCCHCRRLLLPLSLRLRAVLVPELGGRDQRCTYYQRFGGHEFGMRFWCRGVAVLVLYRRNRQSLPRSLLSIVFEVG